MAGNANSGGHVVAIRSSAKRTSAGGLGDRAIEIRRNIEGILSSWTAMVVEELGVTAPKADVRSRSAFLDEHADWLAAHSSAGDLVQELDELACAAVPVIDRRVRGSIELGQCVEAGCSAALVADLEPAKSPSSTLVRCERGHRWTARDWLRTMYPGRPPAAAEDDLPGGRRLVPTKSAARALGVTEATIRQWVHRGKLTRHGTPGSAAYDLAELAELAQRLPDRP
ncbi:hypothetical protein [Amycolatopsis sp. cmx-4-68]|uniref:hypothetical protein n=1 Tax=Amycolatopsis sp. cmx-4-68 TaxID=2790938 RepID=UPI00397E2B89